jgi:hypothetical protein
MNEFLKSERLNKLYDTTLDEIISTLRKHVPDGLI